MATDVERLAVLIEANTKSYERAMKNIERRTSQTMGRARGSVKTLDAQMKASAATARSFMAAFGLTLGIGGIMQLTRSVRGAVSELATLAETADKVGLLTDELQGLRFAAEQTGVAQSALDMGMQRFSRRLAQAAAGNGELVDILKANNIQLRDSEGNMRPLNAILRDYANLIKNATSEQDQLLLAFKAFDSEGAALVNTLRNGSAGLDEFFTKARELGVILDEEGIRKAQDLDAAFKELSATISANFKSAVLSAAEGLSDLVAFFDALDERIRNAGRQTGLNIFENAGGSGRKPLEITVTNPGGKAPAGKPTVIPTKPDAGKSAIDRERDALERLLASRQTELDMLRELDPVKREMIANSGTLAVATGAERAEFEALTRAMLELEAAQEQATEQMAEMQQRLDENRAVARGFFQDMRVGFQNGADMAETFGNAIKRVTDRLAEMATDDLLNLLLGKQGSGGTGLFGTLLGSLFGGGGGGAAAPDFAGLYATGGRIPGGQFGIVGENGPEFVSGPAMVEPMGRRGGGGSVVIQNTIDARGAERGVDARIGAALAEFRRGLPGMITEAQSRARLA